jgi:hypothetical protein
MNGFFSTLLKQITFACTGKRILQCASHARAFGARSHATSEETAKHGFAQRKRERGSCTPKPQAR